MNRWLIVIPARIGSTRLAKKPLQDLDGKPLVIRVYENIQPLLDEGAEIVIATDSNEVLRACSQFGASAIMTRSEHPSGTDRCHEVACNSDRQFILNVQGDEPNIDIEDLRALASFTETGKFSIATLAFHSSSQRDFSDPNVVKIALTTEMNALYFSRAEIPSAARRMFSKKSLSNPEKSTDSKNQEHQSFGFWQHIGIYAYTRQTLDIICKLAPSPLEKAECLEQIRALENNIKIGVVETRHPTTGIDTQEDLERVRETYQ